MKFLSFPTEAFHLALEEVAPERFNEMESIYAIARSQGVAMGKLLPGPLNLIQAGPWIMDAEAGISYQPDDVTALHAALQMVQTEAVPVFEFDFATQPLGLTLAPVQEEGPVESARRIIADHAGLPAGAMELEAWRATQARAVKLCPCCVQAAAQRTLYPGRHPLTRILRHAQTHRASLLTRVETAHFQISAQFTPETVTADKGWVVCANEQNTLHVNLALVHALWIGPARVDDEPFTRLKIIAVHGAVMAEIWSRDVEMADLWQGR